MSAKKSKPRSLTGTTAAAHAVGGGTPAPPTSPRGGGGSGLDSSRKSDAEDQPLLLLPRPSVISGKDKPKRTPSTRHKDHPPQVGAKSDNAPDAFTFPKREHVENLWQVCCDEVRAETEDTNDFLTNFLGLPPLTYKRDKTFPMMNYAGGSGDGPDLVNSKSHDYLDYHIFPYLLPAIQSLIDYAKTHRVLQCRYCAFNPLDYIVEYLYNNNPRYPERQANPIPIFEIGFVKEWLDVNPRPPLPDWMLMTDDQAARIIQRATRGFLARNRPDVQEMRQFWKAYKKDQLQSEQKTTPLRFPSANLMSPYYTEIAGEWAEPEDSDSPIKRPSAVFLTHSDTCEFCQRLKIFLQYQQEMMKDMIKNSYNEDEGEDATETEESSAPSTTTAKKLKAIKKIASVKVLKEVASGKSRQKSKVNLQNNTRRNSVSKPGKKINKGSKN